VGSTRSETILPPGAGHFKVSNSSSKAHPGPRVRLRGPADSEVGKPCTHCGSAVSGSSPVGIILGPRVRRDAAAGRCHKAPGLQHIFNHSVLSPHPRRNEDGMRKEREAAEPSQSQGDRQVIHRRGLRNSLIASKAQRRTKVPWTPYKLSSSRARRWVARPTLR
jgi:hypothetical protein